VLVSPPRSRSGPPGAPQERPAFDVCEGPASYRVFGELPGVEPEQVDLRIAGATLTLRAVGRTQRFYRQLRLPAPVEPDQVEAKLVDGVLSISLPKRAARQVVRPIEIHQLVGTRVAG